MKKQIFILYPDGHISYSPSVLNLYDELSKHFEVTVFSYEPDKYFSSQKPDNRNIVYLPRPGIFKRACFGTLYTFVSSFLGWPKVGFYKFKRQMNLFLKLSSLPKPACLIAVDLTCLWVAQKFNIDVHFLSLEIDENDPLNKYIKKDKITSVIIQSPERYRFYFPENQAKVFYVQNAPVYRELHNSGAREGLIYNGTAIPEFGIFHCIDFISAYPRYSLTVKGAFPGPILHDIESKYERLISDKRLILDTSYVEIKELTAYLSRYRIGFCFYDFSVKKIDTFNYRTAPSGKLFANLAAGTPVIGTNIPGLSAVKEFSCGVLIDDMKPETISSAIAEIESNHDAYVENSIRAARHYSFDKRIAPFIEFLSSRI